MKPHICMTQESVAADLAQQCTIGHSSD